MLMSEVRAERLLRAIDPEIRDSMSSEQEAAVRAAASRNPWEGHLVDIRISVPIPGLRCYLTLVGGRDRRSMARRNQDRKSHPIVSLGNILFFAAATVALGLMAFGILSLTTGLFSY